MDGDDTFDEVQGVAMHGAAAVSRAAEVLIRQQQDQKMREGVDTARVTEDLQRRAEAQAQAAERFYTEAADPDWIRGAAADDIGAAWKGAQQWREIDPDRFTGHATAITNQVEAAYGVSPAKAGDNLDAATWRCVEEVQAARETENGLTQREEATATRERAAEGQAQAADGPDARDDTAEHHDAALDADQAADRHSAAAAEYDTPERRQATDAAMDRAGASAEARQAWNTADQLNGQHPREAVTKRGGRSGARKARDVRGRQSGAERTR